jgi:hypothetical protein
VRFEALLTIEDVAALLARAGRGAARLHHRAAAPLPYDDILAWIDACRGDPGHGAA